MMKNICVKEHAYGTYQSDRRSRRRCAWPTSGKNIFTCEALPADVLAVKGQKKTTRRSSNTHGDENIITSGSRHRRRRRSVHAHRRAGQGRRGLRRAGRVHLRRVHGADDLCRQPRRRASARCSRTSASASPSAARPRKDQRVYYFNTKELTGNKYGTPSPVPFRVVDQRAGIDIDIAIRCFGEYSYRHREPAAVLHQRLRQRDRGLHAATRSTVSSRASCSPRCSRPLRASATWASATRALPGHTTEIAERAQRGALGEVARAAAAWRSCPSASTSVKANEEDEQMIKEMQRDAAYMRPDRARRRRSSRAQARGDEGRRSQHGHGPGHGVHGHGHGRSDGRHQRPESLRNGSAAGGPAGGAAARCSRRSPAHAARRPGGASRRPMAGRAPAVQTVNTGKFCAELRPAQAGGRGLDVRVRRGEQGQVLRRVRQHRSRPPRTALSATSAAGSRKTATQPAEILPVACGTPCSND